jgi:branched-chain amino acid transport system ATP-binding protein
MAEALLQTEGLAKAFGALQAVDGVSLDLRAGEIHALIGPNGAGKTTLLNLLHGTLRPDAGRIRLAGEDLTRLSTPARAQKGLGRTYQITSIFRGFSVLDNVALAVQARAGGRPGLWRAAGGDPRFEAPARKVLEQVGLGDHGAIAASDLAHGQQRQLELAMALAQEPRLLLLDEPMAGIGAGEREAMAALLAAFRQERALLLVEHDMDVVFQIADRISVMVGGRLLRTGRPEEIQADEAVRLAYLGEAGGAADCHVEDCHVED